MKLYIAECCDIEYEIQLGCSFGYGEQMNQITHFHDGSNVYGSDDEDAGGLRMYSQVRPDSQFSEK